MRVVNIGGDKLTAGLAETMSISYAEAEGIKIGMAPEVDVVARNAGAAAGPRTARLAGFF